MPAAASRRSERSLRRRRAVERREGEPDDPDVEDRLNLFHTNSIQVLDQQIDGVCRPGDLLISLRNLDQIAAVDPRRRQVRWRWGEGRLEQQHHPTLLDDGRIVLFDNGVRRRRSRVIELDPSTGEVSWSWSGQEGSPLFSHRRGAVERLPGGAFLITESVRGRALEVTRDGEVVWEFLNPRVRPESRRRAVIYRLARLPRSFLEVCPAPGAPFSVCRP